MGDPTEKLSSGLLNKKNATRESVFSVGGGCLFVLIIKPQMKVHVSHISKTWIFHLAVKRYLVLTKWTETSPNTRFSDSNFMVKFHAEPIPGSACALYWQLPLAKKEEEKSNLNWNTLYESINVWLLVPRKRMLIMYYCWRLYTAWRGGHQYDNESSEARLWAPKPETSAVSFHHITCS